MCSENYKMLRSRMKALLGKEKSQRNPMLAGRRSSLLASNGVDTDKNSISMQDNESLAMQLDVDADHKANLKDIKPVPKLLLACASAGIRLLVGLPTSTEVITSCEGGKCALPPSRAGISDRRRHPPRGHTSAAPYKAGA